MSRNAALSVIAAILVGMVVLWLLKIAFKLILLAVVGFVAIAIFYHLRERFFGGGK